MDERLLRRLRSIATRYRRIRMWKALAGVWSAIAAIGAICLILRWRGVATFADTGWLLLVLSSLLTVAVVIVVRSTYRDERWIAQRVERRFPELRQRLVTALDQRPVNGRYGFLQRQVIDETLQHAAQRSWIERTVPRDRLAFARLLNIPAFIFLTFVIMTLSFTKIPNKVVGKSVADVEPTNALESKVTVKPGDVEVERGTNLIVIARFTGTVPAEAELIATELTTHPENARRRQRIPMTRSLDDPVFGGSFREVSSDFSYHVEYAGQKTDRYRVTVFEYPALVRADARITYPEYTGLAPKLIEDTRRISVVEGSTVQWRCHLNKRVMSAVLIDRKGRSTYLKPPDSAATMYTAEVPLTETSRWELQLVDDAGRTNQYSVELVAKVLPNKQPAIKLEMARDVRVSPLEELLVAVSVVDDYGLQQFGVAYSIGGKQPTEVVLGSQISGKQRQFVEHLLDFESLQAEPDQLLSYHFWAEDHDADGDVRRTFSDMYFAEVRPFEEIFRQGEQPPGGQQQQQQQGQNAQQAQQLAELQKQIINATWKIIRRETSATPTNEFGEDVTLLRDSQSTALEQLTELVEELDDPQSLEHAERVREHMEQAIAKLTSALDDVSIESLSVALSAEQASYQALLKLRAREHDIIRSRQQQGGGSSGAANRSRQQIQQLALDNEQNRYETERQAQTAQQQEQEQQQREIRQVLNRLRELARRQEDLNKQLKELQSALEAAETEAQREEIRRRLQRLREQQQQLLRDTDELTNRLEEAQDLEQVPEAREQLDQTRENVRQAAEALSDNDASTALSAGTRAERDFKRMRDDFRRQAAHQFSEEMREMRDQAQTLDEQQQQLGEQIANLPNAKSGRLRSDDSRDQIREGLQEQRQNLDNLLNRMQQTIHEAETAEPLLAENLYDSFRQTKQRKVDQNLAATEDLLRRGFDPLAHEVEQRAGEAIQELRHDIEQAADSVLGDETEGLRRALAELDQLVDEVDNEVNTADPRGNSQSNGHSEQSTRQFDEQSNDPTDSRSASGEGQPADPRNADGQSAQNEQQTPSQNGGPSARNSSDGSRTRQRDGGGGLQQFSNDSLGGAPLTGDDFRDWSDRLRDVEEMVGDPDLRSEAARVRDRAREIRLDYKRHSKEPRWDDVRKLVVKPLQELRQRVSQELIRRSAARTSLVPIDRDAVPAEFAEQVRRYYEQLGSGD